jgi:hypothetical protein
MLKDKTQRTKFNLYLDIALTVVFLVSLKPFMTGMALHEWLGLALGVGLAVHAALHWHWILGITSKLFGKLPTKTRVYYALDATLLVAFTTITITGILMSRVVLPLFGLQGISVFPLPLVHEWASYVTLALLGVKLALHWAWIKNTVKRQLGGMRDLLSRGRAINPQSPALVPVAVEQREAAQKISRRRFLVIGCSAVCIAALACINKNQQAQGDPIAALTDVVSVDDTSMTTANTSAVTATAEPSATATAVPTVAVTSQQVTTRCPRGMVNDPYPGRCHHYVDQNGNGICDLSETA